MDKQGGPPGVASPPGYSPAPRTAPQPTIATTYTSPGISMTPVPLQVFGPNSQAIVCPSCNQHITTSVRAESSSKTHIMAALLCLVWCCCIPYLVDSCKNQNHYCPSCNAYLGAYRN